MPAAVEVIKDALAELLKSGVKLRFVPRLWDLRNAIAPSSLQFSFIRMRNALPKETSSGTSDVP
jgi:hypothetical protein